MMTKKEKISLAMIWKGRYDTHLNGLNESVFEGTNLAVFEIYTFIFLVVFIFVLG